LRVQSSSCALVSLGELQHGRVHPHAAAGEVAATAALASTSVQPSGNSHTKIRMKDNNCMMSALMFTSTMGWADAHEGIA
jgi:hypothetical protein